MGYLHETIHVSFVASREFFKAQYTLWISHGSTNKIDIEVSFLDMAPFGENGPISCSSLRIIYSKYCVCRSALVIWSTSYSAHEYLLQLVRFWLLCSIWVRWQRDSWMATSLDLLSPRHFAVQAVCLFQENLTRTNGNTPSSLSDLVMSVLSFAYKEANMKTKYGTLIKDRDTHKCKDWNTYIRKQTSKTLMSLIMELLPCI